MPYYGGFDETHAFQDAAHRRLIEAREQARLKREKSIATAAGYTADIGVGEDTEPRIPRVSGRAGAMEAAHAALRGSGVSYAGEEPHWIIPNPVPDPGHRNLPA